MRNIFPKHLFKTMYTKSVAQAVKVRSTSLITIIRNPHLTDKSVKIDLDIIPIIMTVSLVAQKEKIISMVYRVDFAAIPGTILCQ